MPTQQGVTSSANSQSLSSASSSEGMPNGPFMTSIRITCLLLADSDSVPYSGDSSLPHIRRMISLLGNANLPGSGNDTTTRATSPTFPPLMSVSRTFPGRSSVDSNGLSLSGANLPQLGSSSSNNQRRRRSQGLDPLNYTPTASGSSSRSPASSHAPRSPGTRTPSKVVTYFEGEVIDFVNHQLWTNKWQADRKTDMQHWGKFQATKAAFRAGGAGGSGSQGHSGTQWRRYSQLQRYGHGSPGEGLLSSPPSSSLSSDSEDDSDSFNWKDLASGESDEEMITSGRRRRR